MATQRDKYRFLLDNIWAAVDHIEMGHDEIANRIICKAWDVVSSDAERLYKKGKLDEYNVDMDTPS